MIKQGCGWLGWTPDQVRSAHLRDLHLACEGRIEMLRACFGGGEEDKPQNRPIKTAEDFDRTFGVRTA